MRIKTMGGFWVWVYAPGCIGMALHEKAGNPVTSRAARHFFVQARHEG